MVAAVAAGAVNHARDEKKWKLSGSMGTVGGKCHCRRADRPNTAVWWTMQPQEGRKIKRKEEEEEEREGDIRESGNLAKR